MSDETETIGAEDVGTIDEMYGAEEATTFSPDDELDLSGAGLQPETGLFQIEEAKYETNDDGTRWVAIFVPVGRTIEGLINNRVRDSGYVSHQSRPELVNMGKGGLKKLYLAAFGQPKGKLGELPGVIVQAYLSEDKNGFGKLGRYKPAPKEG